MDIFVSKTALEWFKEEFGNDQPVRFFVRYGGCSSIQSGYSLGIEITEPYEPVALKKTDGFTFFVEKMDEWYFDSRDLKVDFDPAIEEITFDYPAEKSMDK
ncbi:hypothetical protein G4V62_03330 [Bacillaceae bacterium SIJ1]|uniref:HesB/YadR/YfhF family protein n=1 Tax=Litoribacterium kuwaitense TaxID=1398745 RepID=UPI0013EACBD6|nr:iron-sulfur cluster biosynthesis family protein [Litoribacterium kuwaitense]NGP44026.1 hypothetical protein [Litoribacterium kuwaitense]